MSEMASIIFSVVVLFSAQCRNAKTQSDQTLSSHLQWDKDSFEGVL